MTLLLSMPRSSPVDHVEQAHLTQPSSSRPTQAEDQPSTIEPAESIIGPRSRPGLLLFLGGAGFLLYSVGLTRRSLARQRRLAVPRYYVWNNAPPPKTNGLPAAIEALVLATLNVCSIGITMAGGWMWALQIRNLEDMRVRLRSKIGGGARPGTQGKEELEEEIEEWVAKILARRAEKDRRKEQKGRRSEQDPSGD
jgi:hypothetical protein